MASTNGFRPIEKWPLEQRQLNYISQSDLQPFIDLRQGRSLGRHFAPNRLSQTQRTHAIKPNSCGLLLFLHLADLLDHIRRLLRILVEERAELG